MENLNVYDVTVYFDVPEGSPIYGIGFTYPVEAPSALAAAVTNIEDQLIRLVEEGKIAEWEVNS